MLPRFEALLAEVIKGVLPDLTQVIHLCVHLTKRSGQPPVIDEVMPIKAGAKSLTEYLSENFYPV